eukprot:s1317_g1.t1
MDERSTKPEYGHFDAILPAQATDEQVFRMPKHAPMAPSTEAWQFLQELYHPVPTKREVKREPAGPCKRERMLPAGGGVVAILDSEEEKDAACPGEALVVLSDDDAEQSIGANVSPAPLQAATVESQNKPRVPVLKVRDHWRDLLLSGAKIWELRTFSCEANQGRIALGYAGVVDGFITFASCKLVGVRVGNGYTGKPERQDDFWLAPHNLDKHKATPQDLEHLGGKGKFLYAWVMEDPVRVSQPLPYPKTQSVTWGSLEVQPSSPEPSEKVPCEEHGKVEAAALKTSFAAETLLHVYNTTWQRLDGTVSMELLQACRNQEEAEQYIRSRALPCTPVPIHIHKVWSAKAAAVPLSCAANGQQGTVASLDLMAAIAQRRKCSREETVLRGLPPGPSLCTVPAEVLGQGVIAPLLHNLHRHRQLAITDDLRSQRPASSVVAEVASGQL